jgi:cell wall assembly regulator SMI1
VKELFDRVHHWLAAHAQHVLAGLAPGASAEQIRAAKEALGVTLPADVKDAYRVHDGGPGFLWGQNWFSLAQMVGEWREMAALADKGMFAGRQSEPDGPIRKVWWHKAWIPLTGDGWGNLYCLDLAPRKGGTVGQVIEWVHDEPQREVAAASFTDWLEDFLAELELGTYGAHPAFAGLVSIDDLGPGETFS